jgi:malonate transporter and related proteins
MSLAVFYKLASILLTVALGFGAGRAKVLGGEAGMRALAGLAQYLLMPALLFRATSRIAFSQLPLGLLAAYFIPVLLVMTGLYLWQRQRPRQGPEVAVPGVRAISLGFGNALQVGIPVVMALYGEAGLGVHLMLVSVHALILLTPCTVLTEAALARERRRMNLQASAWATLGQTLKSTLVHPVVTPVLAGLAFNALGGTLPPVADEWLQMLGAGVVPVCLVLIGLSLAHHGRAGLTRGVLALSAAKLLLLPAVVLVSTYGVFGLRGLPLQVLVMAAALPVGNNALMFAQRYRTLEAETASAVVLSTFGYALSMALWLAVLHRL